MKSKQILLLQLMTCFFVLCNCKPKEILLHNDVKTEYIRTLTPVILPVESASATALLECTREGMILLSRLNVETTKNAKMNILIDSLNNLSVDAVVERDTLYIPSDSVIITKDVLRTEIEYRDKELTKWQKLKQEAGGIAIGGCVALLVLVIIFIISKFK